VVKQKSPKKKKKKSPRANPPNPPGKDSRRAHSEMAYMKGRESADAGKVKKWAEGNTLGPKPSRKSARKYAIRHQHVKNALQVNLGRLNKLRGRLQRGRKGEDPKKDAHGHKRRWRTLAGGW